MYFLTFAICLALVENPVEQAQPKTAPEEMIAQLEVLVDHDDPQTARTALHALECFRTSTDPQWRRPAVKAWDNLVSRAHKLYKLDVSPQISRRDLISLDEILLKETNVTAEGIVRLRKTFRHATITWDDPENTD